MEKSELYFAYAMWLVIILAVTFLFNFISKKTSNLVKLLIGTILPTWLVVSVISYINSSFIPLTSKTFIDILVHMGATVLFIGGITFIYKYRKFKNKYKAK